MIRWLKSKFVKEEPRYELSFEFVTMPNLSMSDLIMCRRTWLSDPNAIIRNMKTGEEMFSKEKRSWALPMTDGVRAEHMGNELGPGRWKTN